MPLSVEIRNKLVEALHLDLVGPDPGGPHANEMLPMSPSRWYLAGFLVPYEAPDSQKEADDGDEGIDSASDSDGDDDNSPDPASARKAFFPSSIGLSVLVPSQTKSLQVTVDWGDYRPVGDAGQTSSEGAVAAQSGRELWRREPGHETLPISLGKGKKPKPTLVRKGDNLELVVTARTVPHDVMGLVPKGTKAVSIFLVNHRKPSPDASKDEAFVFQAALAVRLEEGFVARPNLRGVSDNKDWDERVADLQFRDAFEFAVGHGVSTHATVDADGVCREVQTSWIPSAEVEKVEPSPVPGVTLEMEALAQCASPGELQGKLAGFTAAYGAWIEAQGKIKVDHDSRADVAKELLQGAQIARKRIEEGIKALGDNQAFEAFRTANRVMALAARQRSPQLFAKKAPSWRPFQLAFLLMNLRGMIDPSHPERSTVDLLFFPTGGGKTEAYLGLAAFTLVLRRLRNPDLSSAGLTVLMRYTLRLLTLDQLGRAATLICALELERQKDPKLLGTWPFEIGLWVGLAATPNRMGRKGDNDRHSARAKTIAFQNNSAKKPAPIPIETCPWCGTKFDRDSFRLLPNSDHPAELRVQCASRTCAFGGKKTLPIVTVDEAIYERLPCFLIATVDKFAQLPWVGRTGMLFGKAQGQNSRGFFGPCDPGVGTKLAGPLLPPDLIIQDELHLISGPLGTMVGLYETAIDSLSSRTAQTGGASHNQGKLFGASEAGGQGDLPLGGQAAGQTIRPKIIASTATVRRAEAQIRALFGRSDIQVFPPPGPDRRDSFFARTVRATERPARLYVGVAAQGRSLKVVLLRTYLALLSAAQKLYLEAGGDKAPDNPVDPYMTLLGYFSSLRELGGSRRIVEDEVTSRLLGYERRVRQGETSGPFARRSIAHEVEELTSRKSTNQVAETKRRLSLPFRDKGDKDHKGSVDVALATNMISVGLDITRLGLMVVLGQPKTTSEYIQASSRVGRDDQKPGLVVTLQNIHRPRDRSHYERFEAYHATFYRDVEATSVTPFSPRALDRGLAAVLVSMARLGFPELTAPAGAVTMKAARPKMGPLLDAIAERAAEHAALPAAEREALKVKVQARGADLLDAWAKIATFKHSKGAGLQYASEGGSAPPLLRDPLDPELKSLTVEERKFKAQRSLRDVEPSVNICVKSLSGATIELEEEEVEG